MNTSNATLYADATFASTNQPWVNGTNSYTAIAQDSYFMKMKVLLHLLIFILGIILGSILTYSFQAKKSRELIAIYQKIYMFNEFAKCNRAYFQRSPEVSIYALENFVNDTMSLLPKINTNEYIYKVDMFVVNARLAKLYKNIGNQEKAEQYFRSAIISYNDMTGSISPRLSISNDTSVLNELQRYDANLRSDGVVIPAEKLP